MVTEDNIDRFASAGSALLTTIILMAFALGLALIVGGDPRNSLIVFLFLSTVSNNYLRLREHR